MVFLENAIRNWENIQERVETTHTMFFFFYPLQLALSFDSLWGTIVCHQQTGLVSFTIGLLTNLSSESSQIGTMISFVSSRCSIEMKSDIVTCGWKLSNKHHLTTTWWVSKERRSWKFVLSHRQRDQSADC